ncbi:MAG: winged helix-turn-helix domain-containing protein [Candidatus Nanohaloarchaea archaeon]
MPEVDDSVLAKIFGDTPMVSVLDVLLDHPEMDYSKKELAEAAGISEPTLYRVWPRLEELGIVTETRKYGNAQLYTLDTGSDLVEDIIRFEQSVLESSAVASAVEA